MLMVVIMIVGSRAMIMETETEWDEMQEAVTEHRSDSQADEHRHELLVHVRIEARDYKDAT